MNSDNGYCQNYQKILEKNTGLSRKIRNSHVCDGRNATITEERKLAERLLGAHPEATHHGD